MVKSYLRYALQDSFGTDFVLTGHDERVSVWNCRTGEARVNFEAKPDDLHAPSDVTAFVCSDGVERWLYVGYADGSIRRFQRPESLAGEAVSVVNEDFHVQGHKNAVTCLALSPFRQLLASGSQDCSIIIWDTTGDLGLFRLEGHRNEITDLRFVSHAGGSESQLKSRRLGAERASVKQGDDILGFLLSVSKDCIVRVWDLTSQLCIQTVIHSTAELYSIAVNSNESRFYVGGSENRIRCYKLDVSGSEKEENSAYDIPVYAKELPSLNRPENHGRCRRLCIMYPGAKDAAATYSGRKGSRASGKESAKVLEIDQKGLMLCVTTTFVVFYRLYDSAEAAKRRKRRQKRHLEKQRARCNKLREALRATGREVTVKFDSLEATISHLEKLLSGTNPVEPADPSASNAASSNTEFAATDELNYMFAVNAFERIASFALFSSGFVIGYANNRVSVWRVQLQKLLSPKTADDDSDMEDMVSLCERVHLLDAVGHPSPIMGLGVSPSDTMLLSFSAESLKVWNSHTLHAIRTFDCKAVACAYFVAGNRHILAGTSTGELRVLYLDTCDVHEVYKLAADTSKRSSDLDVISICEHPDHASFAAAFRDRCVRVFQYMLKKKGSQEVLCVKEVSSTSLADDPTEVRYSSDGRLLAVALHDSTVQTFYTDTMKPFLSLYGHKLPVTSIDISSDGTLLASSSLDKTIKIWGLDFGNIRRSLLGHSSAVVKCRWINNTHYLVTTSLDSSIKLWDCDTYELICQLRGHSTAVRSLAVSSDAHFFISASDDSTIRFWRRTDEQIFLSEEREKELELQLEHEVVRDDLNQAIPVDRDALLNKATRKTVQSVKATEDLMRVIDEAEEYRQALEDHKQQVRDYEEMTSGTGALSKYGTPDTAPPKEPDPPLELFNRTPTEHVMMAVCSLTHSVVHEVLIALPFIYAEKLLNYIVSSLESYSYLCGSGTVNLHTMEMASKTALLLVQIYFRQFFALSHQRPLIARLERLLPQALQHELDRIRRNKAALEHLKGLLDADVLSKRLRDP
ncbi:WD domain, G-beta repeat containing protein, putative [Babesia bigemina]|uniref:WD domain, G-beta repeat containing protein, putative n=1 Tax=Babesia bigemina TaxID=5866 RepID=A0A061D0V1_BABBI|nr:WD domain, G-beta repeat containing protein, putative [Babesia bigemina]CDR93757.1 WD domain, G-beta repeat containing protein, putative [Babesia bigemina]|eukprot:XP_012765943.1 WD domain, G-beta repeat containing protein, putative [Babesia bigemina]